METAYAVWRQNRLLMSESPILSGIFELKPDAQEYVSIRTADDKDKDWISYEIKEVKYWPRLPVQDLSK